MSKTNRGKGHPRWNRIEAVCQQCGKPFGAKKTLVEKGYGKYCSKRCADQALKGGGPRWKGGPVTVNCAICNKEFEAPKYLLEKGQGKYCSRRCAGLARRNKVTATCEVCGREFNVVPSKIKAGEGKYCSRACFHKAHGPKQTAKNNPNWKGGTATRTCAVCGQAFDVRHVLIKQSSVRFCSYDCYWAFMKEDEGVKDRMRDVAQQQEQQKGPNKLELAGYAILDSIGVPYVRQKKLAEKFVVDAFLPESDIVIQFDGDYWHGNPAKYKKVKDYDEARDIGYRPLNKVQRMNTRKDAGQTAYLRKCDYTVLRFWESDVKTNPDEVRAKILAAVEEAALTTEGR
jgi:very-short-patch-repair endonuclease